MYYEDDMRHNTATTYTNSCSHEQVVVLRMLIPNGYEATGEYRKPSHDDWFLTIGGTAQQCHSNDMFGLNNYRIILRRLTPPFIWPVWFKTGWWLYKWSNSWYVSDKQPTPGVHGYVAPVGSTNTMNAESLCRFHGEKFDPPKHLECIQKV